MNTMDWILDRLKEPTTYAGIFAGLTAVGVQIAPELADAIMSAGIGVVGLVLVILKEA